MSKAEKLFLKRKMQKLKEQNNNQLQKQFSMFTNDKERLNAVLEIMENTFAELKEAIGFKPSVFFVLFTPELVNGSLIHEEDALTMDDINCLSEMFVQFLNDNMPKEEAQLILPYNANNDKQ